MSVFSKMKAFTSLDYNVESINNDVIMCFVFERALNLPYKMIRGIKKRRGSYDSNKGA